MAKQITDANFKELVLEAKGLVVVDCWAQWCGPCKMLGPIIDQMATEFEGKAVIGKLNVDENPDTTMAYGIRNIPAILFFKDGEVVDKQIGVSPASALRYKIESNL